MTTRLIAALAAALLLVAACSSDPESPAEGPGEAQPGVGGELVSGALADVPVPDAARAVGDTVQQDGRQTQSYEVTATSPELVQEFYAEELPGLGWEVISEEGLAQGARSMWRDGERELLIAAEDEGQITTLSLQVTDAGATPPGVEGASEAVPTEGG